MRVAHIITRLIIGGAQENTFWTVDDQQHLFGDDVCLISGPGVGPEGSLEQDAHRRGLDLRLVPALQRSISVRREPAALRSITRLLRDYRPDIVHTHSSKAGILGRFAAARLRIPAVHTIHGAAFHYGQSRFVQGVYRMLERRAARWCDHLISVCDAMTRQYVAAGIAPPEKFTTIYSGMDVDRFLVPDRPPHDIRAQLGLRPEHVVVTKVARLFPLKGHAFLIEAAPRIVAAVPQVRFLLVGDGVLRAQFAARIAELGLQEHFVFAGLVTPRDIPDLLHASDLVVHTSVWEGLPRVLPQALLTGRPVVSFDNDGAPEVCLPEETGVLVPVRNVDRLAEGVIRLAQDAALRERLGAAGRQRCAALFRHETMTEQIRAVYRRVLDERAA